MSSSTPGTPNPNPALEESSNQHNTSIDHSQVCAHNIISIENLNSQLYFEIFVVFKTFLLYFVSGYFLVV